MQFGRHGAALPYVKCTTTRWPSNVGAPRHEGESFLELSALLLGLYQAAHEECDGGFQERMLGVLKQAVGFDSAIWGNGLLHRDGRLVPHVMHLHRQPCEALQEWARINVKDPVIAACVPNPWSVFSFHAPTLFVGPQSTQMRAYAKRYGRQSYLACCVPLACQPGLVAWLSLYRSDPNAQFSDAQRLLYSHLVRHLFEALQINRRLQLHQTFDADDPQGARAIADPWGYFHSPSDDLQALLGLEWPNFLRGRLPQALLDALNAAPAATYRGREIIVRTRTVGGFLFIQVRRRALLDGLSARERQVAESVVRGLSAKESGKALGVSPATVRVHLQRIFEKLEVHSQAEVAYLLGRAQPRPRVPDRPMIREAG